MTDLEIIEEIQKDFPSNNFEYKINENNDVISFACISLEGSLSKKLEKLQNIKKFYCFGSTIENLSALKKIKKIEEIKFTNDKINFKELAKLISNFDFLVKIKIIHTSYIERTLPFQLLKEFERLNLSINDLNDKKGFKCENIKYPPRILTDFGFCNAKLYIDNYESFIEFQKKDENSIQPVNFLKKIISEFKKQGNKIDFSNKFELLPLALQQFFIKDFHDIREIHVKDIPNNTKWIFLTGENGYGKTSILQALVITLLGKNEDDGELLDKQKLLNSFLGGHKRESLNQQQYFTNIFNVPNNTGIFHKDFHFAAYGAVRVNKSADRKSKTYSMFHSDGTLLDIEAKFREWEGSILSDIYLKVKKILLKLLSPYIDNIKVEIDKKKSLKTVKYHEKESKSDVWLEYDQLASGYKSIIATFGDMIIRLTESIGAGVDELYGIVLIDEFDLHLHPRWQKELVERLTKVFPKIQFIVSTHSPIPILGAPENSIIINVDRDKENGITAKILDVDFKNLTPNSILTSPIFNFHSIIPESNTDLKDLQTKDDYNEVVFQKIVKQKLNDFIEENKDIDKEFDKE
jgi:predicted ATPase